jgi:hypothetical protein
MGTTTTTTTSSFADVGRRRTHRDRRAVHPILRHPYASNDIGGIPSRPSSPGSVRTRSSSSRGGGGGEGVEYDVVVGADDIPDPTPPTDELVESRTLAWVRNVVIGYGLCPFAERPLREGKLRLVTVRGDDDLEVSSTVLYELISRSSSENVGTTLVIAPEYHPNNFVPYMSLVQYIEDDLMERYELHGIVQLAPFHPRFVFDGNDDTDIDNHTNRGPYPIFHVLREDEVSVAVDKLGGDAGRVWRRNVDLLRGMEERHGGERARRALTVGGGGEGDGDNGDDGDGMPPAGMEDLLREVRERNATS